jgi:hypothetical protein
VTRLALRALELLLVPTVALGVALVISPQRTSLWVHIWLLVVLAIAFVALVGVVGRAYPRTPSPFEASLHRPQPVPERPSSLVRLEREVTMAGASAFDLHARLRPTIQALAADMLASRRGIDLARDPERARAVLGDDVWDIVRPDRPAPSVRHAAGIDDATLGRVVTALEAI